MVLSLEILDMASDTKFPLSHTWGAYGYNLSIKFSLTQAPRSTSVLASIVPQMHFSGVVQTDLCIVFVCPVNVAEHRQDYDPMFKRYWIPFHSDTFGCAY